MKENRPQFRFYLTYYVSRHITHRNRELSLAEQPDAPFMRNPWQEQEVNAVERECRLAEAIGRLTTRERQHLSCYVGMI